MINHNHSNVTYKICFKESMLDLGIGCITLTDAPNNNQDHKRYPFLKGLTVEGDT